MPDYDNNMRGVLFRNDRKETDSHPDYKGSCEVNGQQFWLSAWIKTKQSDGSKYMSLSFQPKQAQGSGGGAPVAAPAPTETIPTDDIPF